jgi:thiol-disulfide isomerase/thioredoxin
MKENSNQLLYLLKVVLCITLTGLVLSCKSTPGRQSLSDSELNRFKKITLPRPEIRPFIGLGYKLAEVGGDSIALGDLKSKVLLIEFTGVHCGPCNESISFLEKLVIDYKDRDFEFISIETEKLSYKELAKFKKKKHMNYKYLIGGVDVLEKFEIDGVPAFFVLDEKRIIRKFIMGYRKETTDNEIRESINKLL